MLSAYSGLNWDNATLLHATAATAVKTQFNCGKLHVEMIVFCKASIIFKRISDCGPAHEQSFLSAISLSSRISHIMLVQHVTWSQNHVQQCTKILLAVELAIPLSHLFPLVDPQNLFKGLKDFLKYI